MRPARVRSGGSGERGAGTVLVMAVVALAGLLLCVVLATGRAVQVRHRAQGAADLAALAAAAVVEEGGAAADGCAAAGVVAAANLATVSACAPRPDGDVTVAVEVDLGIFAAFGLGSSDGTARAGPLTHSP